MLTSPVRARTSPARARIIIKCACACALRCFTGYNDILTGGTLEKNISFLLVPASEEDGSFHIEAVNVRFDNLFHSPRVGNPAEVVPSRN